MFLRIFLTIVLINITGMIVDCFTTTGDFAFASARLNNDINETDTVFYVNDATGFPDYGYVKIDNEYIGYTGIAENTTYDGTYIFSGCLRGQLETVPANHYVNDTVYSKYASELDDLSNFESTEINSNFGDFSIFKNPFQAFINMLTWNYDFMRSSNPMIVIIRIFLSGVSFCCVAYFGWMLIQAIGNLFSGALRLFGR